MRYALLLLATLALAGCTAAKPAATPTEAEPATAAVDSGADEVPPLFIYEEGGDSLLYRRPGSVTLLAGQGTTAPCETSLSSAGNMWTPADIEAALADPVVEAELETTPPRTFAAKTGGVLTMGGHTVRWEDPCEDCPPSPPAVAHLRDVLEVLMLNRRLVCRESAN